MFVFPLFSKMAFDDHSHDSAKPNKSCLELALEAERLCKSSGNYSAAIRLFQQSLSIGTENLSVLSAVYSQLGNAYFYQHDFIHALEFHRWDLQLSRFVVLTRIEDY